MLISKVQFVFCMDWLSELQAVFDIFVGLFYLRRIDPCKTTSQTFGIVPHGLAFEEGFQHKGLREPVPGRLFVEIPSLPGLGFYSMWKLC